MFKRTKMCLFYLGEEYICCPVYINRFLPLKLLVFINFYVQCIDANVLLVSSFVGPEIALIIIATSTLEVIFELNLTAAKAVK